MTRQKVVLHVIDGEHEATIEHSIMNAWPGRDSPPIEDMIQGVAQQMIDEIMEAKGR